MICNKTTCSVYIICQKKANPPERCNSMDSAKLPGTSIFRNGYARMAAQEQIARMSAIEFTGNWGE